jgi:hypothetical protein
VDEDTDLPFPLVGHVRAAPTSKLRADEHCTIDSADSTFGAEALRRAQLQDPHLRAVIEYLETRDNPPPADEIRKESRKTKAYLAQWPTLTLIEGVLCRRFVDNKGLTRWTQLIPPPCLRRELLRQVHTGIRGSHLGLKKTLDQLQRRAYWVDWKQNTAMYCRQCPDHAPSNTHRTTSKSPLAPSNTSTNQADAVHPTVSESNPLVAHFSPVDCHLGSSPALTPPPEGAVLLDLGTNLADLAQSSPDPFWSCVAGPASSVDIAFEAPMSTPPVEALCRGVRRSKVNGLHASTHMVEAAASPLASAVTPSHVIPSIADPIPSRVISAAADDPAHGNGMSTSSCEVAPRRIHTSGNPAPCQNRLSGPDGPHPDLRRIR